MLIQSTLQHRGVPSSRLPFGLDSSFDGLSFKPKSDDAGSAGAMQWLALVLDEIDYGIVLVTQGQTVLYSNHAARRELRRDSPLRLDTDRLCAQLGSDAATLREALSAATQRGMRRLVVLGGSRKSTVVAVVPLSFCHDDEPVALVMLGKGSVCESLSAQGFASAHGLTPMEQNVLAGLCAGHAPRRIADDHGVSLSTVRAQIASIRGKTGAASIRALLERVAQLPPLVGALRTC